MPVSWPVANKLRESSGIKGKVKRIGGLLLATGIAKALHSTTN